MGKDVSFYFRLKVAVVTVFDSRPRQCMHKLKSAQLSGCTNDFDMLQILIILEPKSALNGNLCNIVNQRYFCIHIDHILPTHTLHTHFKSARLTGSYTVPMIHHKKMTMLGPKSAPNGNLRNNLQYCLVHLSLFLISSFMLINLFCLLCFSFCQWFLISQRYFYHGVCGRVIGV